MQDECVDVQKELKNAIEKNQQTQLSSPQAKQKNGFFRFLDRLKALNATIAKKPWLVIVIMAGILAVLIVLFMFTSMSANFSRDMWDRFPMILAIILISIAVGYSTVSFQTITGARILTPGVLGFENIYMFLQTILLLLVPTLATTLEYFTEYNFVFSLLIMVGFSLLIFMPLFTKGSKGIYTLLLVGIILSTLFASLTSFMQFLIDPDMFRTIEGLMFASFVAPDFLLMSVSAVIMVISFFIAPSARTLDVLSLGRDNAISLGVNHKRASLRILIVVAILVSVSTVVVGPVMFLGLISANLAYQFIKSYKHKYTIPAAVLVSAIALVGAELVMRFFTLDINVAVIINFFGGIYFIFILMRERGKGR